MQRKHTDRRTKKRFPTYKRIFHYVFLGPIPKILFAGSKHPMCTVCKNSFTHLRIPSHTASPKKGRYSAVFFKS